MKCSRRSFLLTLGASVLGKAGSGVPGPFGLGAREAFYVEDESPLATGQRIPFGVE